jgi:light-regulated signal transduction histidine kinase (bacteriophytochrome)
MLLGKTDADFLTSEDEIRQFRSDDREVIASGRAKFTPEQSLTDVSGKSRLLQTTRIPFALYGTSTPAILGVSTDITELKQAGQQILKLNAELEERVRQRTAELASANRELEAFAYSVSHDLRAPLRGIDGWSLALLEDYSDKLDTQAQDYLTLVRTEVQRMSRLIDDLLKLSRLSRSELRQESIDLSAMVESIAKRVRQSAPERTAEFVIRPSLQTNGDPSLVEAALQNLMENAWKFSGKNPQARIEFGSEYKNGRMIYFVRDNGAGFDMAYAKKLFVPFQRLHKTSDFPGTGIGLATVQRIIRRHGGEIWAEGTVGAGAAFFFTLGA